ncbi:MAG: hypothetical protein KC561_12715, partial [Myxococcales bacterium]|nr:hypothetical protein [Myxococcales bacterium]
KDLEKTLEYREAVAVVECIRDIKVLIKSCEKLAAKKPVPPAPERKEEPPTNDVVTPAPASTTDRNSETKSEKPPLDPLIAENLGRYRSLKGQAERGTLDFGLADVTLLDVESALDEESLQHYPDVASELRAVMSAIEGHIAKMKADYDDLKGRLNSYISAARDVSKPLDMVAFESLKAENQRAKSLWGREKQGKELDRLLGEMNKCIVAREVGEPSRNENATMLDPSAQPTSYSGKSGTYEQQNAELFRDDDGNALESADTLSEEEIRKYIQMTDVNQGSIGDCYFLAVLAGVVNVDASYAANMIQPIGPELFQVTLFDPGAGNRPVRIVVDNKLPSDQKHAKVVKPLLQSKSGEFKELWVVLVEKAFAKFIEARAGTPIAGLDDGLDYGGYRSIGSGGYTDVAFAILTGQSGTNVPLSGRLGEKRDAWNQLSQHIQAGGTGTASSESTSVLLQQLSTSGLRKAMNCAIASDEGKEVMAKIEPDFESKHMRWSPDELRAYLVAFDAQCGEGLRKAYSGPIMEELDGVVAGHAYTIVAAEIQNGRKMIQLRNPWGDSGIKGAPKEAQGSFWITFDDFFTNYRSMTLGFT